MVELVFLATPLHPSYKAGIPEDISQTYRQKMEQLKSDHVHVAEIDAMDWVFEDGHYIDGDHLNADGASIFTSSVELSPL